MKKLTLSFLVLSLFSTYAVSDQDLINRHYLSKLSETSGMGSIHDPLKTYNNIARGHISWWVSIEKWTAPNGEQCSLEGYTKSCSLVSVNKSVLKEALNIKYDSELNYLIGRKFYATNSYPVNPWTIKDIKINESTVDLYGADRPYGPFGHNSGTTMVIFGADIGS